MPHAEMKKKKKTRANLTGRLFLPVSVDVKGDHHMSYVSEQLGGLICGCDGCSSFLDNSQSSEFISGFISNLQ